MHTRTNRRRHTHTPVQILGRTGVQTQKIKMKYKYFFARKIFCQHFREERQIEHRLEERQSDGRKRG